MRFVYHLQDSSTSEEEEDEPESDSDDSSSSRRMTRTSRRIRSGKQRMSITTNQLFNVPRLEEGGHGYYDYGCGHGPEMVPTRSTKRRFFASFARWDDRLQQVLVHNEGLAMPRLNIVDLMESGGRSREPDAGSDAEEEMEVDEEEGES